ncbi:MAG TPA: hypothetical protein DER01_19055 [Phycisphaerales bacterium]|nr:hypothetical protein [Phycisphaerales bacterium]
MMIRPLHLMCLILGLVTFGCTTSPWVNQHLGDKTTSHHPVTKDTIDHAKKLSPEQAVVIDPNIIFSISNCAMGSHTDYAWTQTIDGHPRFTVAWPNHRHVWPSFNFMQVDPKVYPILVMTYRAKNTVQNSFWDYHIDLFSKTEKYRSPYRGIRPDVPTVGMPLVADGQLREYRVDTRTCQFKPGDGITPTNPYYSIWFGTRSGQQVPATFDFVGLRFESTDQTRPQTAYADDVPISVRVVDQTGLPINNAKVVVDAQRLNFARSDMTNKEGLATITPLKNEVDQHMIRVEKDGFVTTEFFNVTPLVNKPVTLHMSKAVVFRGTVVDDRGKGIPDVAVRMYPANRFESSSGGKVNTRVAVKTDSDGRWQSPPMPVEVTDMCLRLTHPDYVSDNHAMIKAGHSAKEMTLNYPIAVMHDGITFQSKVIPAQDLTLEKLKVVLTMDTLHNEQLKALTQSKDQFKFFTIARQSGQIFITAQNHEPLLIDFNASTKALPESVQLKPGRHLVGQIIYPSGMSTRLERLEIRLGNKQQFSVRSTKIDNDGNWEFKNAPTNVPLILYANVRNQRVKIAEIGPNENKVQITMPTSDSQPQSKSNGSSLQPNLAKLLGIFRLGNTAK